MHVRLLSAKDPEVLSRRVDVEEGSDLGRPLRHRFLDRLMPSSSRPGSTYEPQCVILTTAGALVATYLGQALGWYQAGQGAGFIASIVGAMLILLVWGFIGRRTQ